MAFLEEIIYLEDGAYVINLDKKQSIGTYWVSAFIDKTTAVHFDSFRIEYILQEVLSKIKDKSITHKIFRIQDDDSIGADFIVLLS